MKKISTGAVRTIDDRINFIMSSGADPNRKFLQLDNLAHSLYLARKVLEAKKVFEAYLKLLCAEFNHEFELRLRVEAKYWIATCAFESGLWDEARRLYGDL